jgi:serine/threonine-protein kinase HipA
MQVVVGNMDAHAKNYALLYTAQGPQLAPSYDVVCTEVYEQLDRQLSMNVGHTRDPERLTKADLLRFARDLNVSPSIVTAQIDRLIAEVPGAVDTLWNSTPSHPITERMHDLIGRRLLLMKSVRTGVSATT